MLDRIAPSGARVVVPNGVDPEEWARPGTVPASLDSRSRPWIAYVGNMDDRVDVAVLSRIADEVPGATFALCGPLLRPRHFAPLRERPNVVFLGRRDRATVVGVVRAADACVMPHRRTKLTASMSPIKIYEYLAGGARVVTTDLPSVRGVSSELTRVSDDDEFVDRLKRVLEEPARSESARREFARANSWERRHRTLLDRSVHAD